MILEELNSFIKKKDLNYDCISIYVSFIYKLMENKKQGYLL
jgi:hypothetical protein